MKKNKSKRKAFEIRKQGHFVRFPVDFKESEEYRIIWRTVLDRTLADHIEDMTYPDDEMTIEEWLETEDFDTVCDLADIETVEVRKVFNEAKEKYRD